MNLAKAKRSRHLELCGEGGERGAALSTLGGKIQGQEIDEIGRKVHEGNQAL